MADFKTPTELFTDLKQKKQNTDDAELHRMYVNALVLAEKYKETGQKLGARKLEFYINNYEREKKLIDAGINTFVYRSDIEFYIKNISSDRVSIIELENYPREVPDDIVDVIKKYKKLFDQLYIVFTDYTEQLKKDVEEERKKETDPILFGAFKDENTNTISERFYYLGDWEDEYCDLTLDKLVAETKSFNQAKVDHYISNPQDLEELKKELQELKPIDRSQSLDATAELTSVSVTNGDNQINFVNPDYKSNKNRFFAHVKSFFTRKRV